MLKRSFFQSIKIPKPIKLDPELLAEYRLENSKRFVVFFRMAAVFGMLAYFVMLAWDWYAASKAFDALLLPRLTLIGALILAFAASFHDKFYVVAQYVGMLFFLLFMANIIWVQSIIEAKLEEGYGMLITPGSSSSIIVFSGAEMGYGALLTPLLILPIAFNGIQAGIISLIVVGAANYGMQESTLPTAFVNTANSIFISLGVFTTILAFLVDQQRRSAFKFKCDLEDANKAKSSFLATMSHEVRTPLAGMLGITSLLEEMELGSKQRSHVETIKYSGETLLAMLNDILDFSKMEAGKFEIEKIDIDFNRLLHSCVELMRSRADEKGITIKLNVKSDVPAYIFSDPTRLRQVLLNLLSNAIKFTDTGYVMLGIKLAGKDENGDMILRFAVRDTGIGMSEEVMNKLFKEFAQADESTSRKYGGTGLGLSICQSIVDMMGGQIKVTSQVGEGSTFYFEIPMQIGASPSEQSDDAPRAIMEVGSQTILLVEDDKTIAKYTSIMLQKQHHEVVLAETGKAALKAAKEQVFDLVFMDYNLPDMNGCDIARDMRQIESFPANTAIIGLTANSEAGFIEECEAAGMNGYIVKPLDKVKMQSILADHGTKREASQQDDGEEGGNLAVMAIIEDLGRDYAKEIVQEFIDGIEAKLVTLEAALEQRQLDVVKVNAHDITSMSGTTGLYKTQKLFKTIELEVEDHSIETLAAMATNAIEVYRQEKASIELIA